MKAGADTSNPEYLLNLAASNGLFWRCKNGKGLLEYRRSKLFMKMIIGLLVWSIVAFFPLLLGNPGLVKLTCERSSPQQGICIYQKIYLHPFLLWFRPQQEIVLSEIIGPRIDEIEGDESDSYRFVLETRHGPIPIFTAAFESTAEERAEELLFFLRKPQEDSVTISYFDTLFFWIMYLPLYLGLLYLGLALLTKLSGRPFGCHWAIFDTHTRQLVIIRNTRLGWSFTRKVPLGSIQTLEIKEIEGENSDYFSYQVRLKSGVPVPLTPRIPIKEGFEFERMQHYLLEQMQKFLQQSQAKDLSSDLLSQT